MRNTFIVISCLLTIASVVPYVRDIVSRKTKPRIVSWFNWMVLTIIAATASLSDGQYPAAIFSFFAAVEVGIVLVLGIYYEGERSISLFDITCQIAAAIGLLLWYVFNSPEIAIAAVIIIDLIVSLPTLKHSWQKPYEETWITYFLSGLGANFVLLAATEFKITSVANPLYLIFINYLLAGILLYRRKYGLETTSQKTHKLG